MGYENYYSIEISEHDDENKQSARKHQVINDLILKHNEIFCDIICDDGSTNGSSLIYYSDVTNILKYFSKNNPNDVFILTRIGELPNDFSRYFIMDGKMYEVEGEIVFPKFNKNNLD